jgi:hypothetical protein
MKTWKDFWITLALGLVLGLIAGWLVREVLTRRYDAELAAIEREMAIADSIHLAQIDSIMRVFTLHELEYDSLEIRYQQQLAENRRLDQRNRQLQQAYDQITAQVGAMDPNEKVAQMDSLSDTAHLPPTAIVDSLPGHTGLEWAIMPLPRIDAILVQMLQNVNLHQRVSTLERTVVERDGTILTLHSIIINRNEQIERLMVVIEEKEGQIRVRNTWVETLRKDNQKLRRQLTLTKIGAAAVIVLVGYAAVKAQ